MRTAAYLFLVFTLCACKTSEKARIPNPKEYVICPIPEHYIRFNDRCKSRNLDMITYSFNNSHKDFIKIWGDFMNVKYQAISDLNIACTYSRSFGNLKNVITVEVRMSSSSKWKTDNYKIKAVSSKFGEFIKVENFQFENRKYPYSHFYIKELQLDQKLDVLKMIKNDTVTLYVENQKYEFISPVME